MDAAHLTKLPREIILEISRHLPTRDLGNFRRACKAIEQAMFRSFSREYFTKKQFMLSQESLAALLEITKDPALSPVLTHLEIGLDHYDSRLPAGITPSSRQGVRYRTGAAQQHNFCSTGKATVYLAEALKGLPNLTTVVLRDFNSRRPHRDGHGIVWRSYGSTTILHETGVRLPMGAEPRAGYASEVFATVMTAIAWSRNATGGRQPVTIEVMLRSRTWGLGDFAFVIPTAESPAMSVVLQSLKTLHLDVFLGAGDISPAWYPPPLHLQDGPTSFTFFRGFLSSATNLTWLRLNFQESDNATTASIMSWISGDTQPPVLHLPHLERLDLGSVTTTIQSLLAVFAKFGATLKEGNLWRVKVADPRIPAGERVNVWANLFRAMAPRAPRMVRWRVGHLIQMFEGQSLNVYFGSHFPGDVWTGLPVERVCSRTNTPMADVLAKLAAETLVQWPPEEDEEDGDEGDDDDDNDDDDEGGDNEFGEDEDEGDGGEDDEDNDGEDDGGEEDEGI